MTINAVLAAELTWTGTAFERNVAVTLGAAGQIDAVGQDHRPTHTLPRRALLPGFVNAHSHAFQRGLRGRGETFPAAAGSFWTWREAMYELVGTLDPERVFQLSRQAFSEMLAAGMTTVGEFHYVHHSTDEGRDHALDEAVLRAAAEAGIRLVLLQVYYRTGGIGQPLTAAQRRFAAANPNSFWQQVDRLQGLLDPASQSLGVVVHSIRAASLDDLVAVHREAMDRGLVFHIHVEEQRKEIEDCLAAYGARPMALLNERLAISPATTAIHCTHTDPEDMARYLAAGGRVCLCPLTEANLGDGIADLPGILAATPPGALPLCLGSDSNARISMLEEIRWLEYAQRLRSETRGVCRDHAGRVAPVLLAIATGGGAAALGIDAGAITPGHHGDLVAINLDAPSLSGCDAESLLDGLVCGARDDVVREVWVGGRQITPAS